MCDAEEGRVHPERSYTGYTHAICGSRVMGKFIVIVR